MTGRKLAAIALAGGGALVLAPAVWIGIVAVFTAVGALLDAPGPLVGVGALCGMVGAFVTALGCGLVARGLLRRTSE